MNQFKNSSRPLAAFPGPETPADTPSKAKMSRRVAVRAPWYAAGCGRDAWGPSASAFPSENFNSSYSPNNERLAAAVSAHTRSIELLEGQLLKALQENFRLQAEVARLQSLVTHQSETLQRVVEVLHLSESPEEPERKQTVESAEIQSGKRHRPPRKKIAIDALRPSQPFNSERKSTNNNIPIPPFCAPHFAPPSETGSGATGTDSGLHIANSGSHITSSTQKSNIASDRTPSSSMRLSPQEDSLQTPNGTNRSPQPKKAHPQLPPFKFSEITSVADAVREWFDGVDGNPSIVSLETRYGSAWRDGPRGHLTRTFYRRKRLVRAVQKLMDSAGLSRAAAVAQLDDARADGSGGRKSVYWLCDHLPV